MKIISKLLILSMLVIVAACNKDNESGGPEGGGSKKHPVIGVKLVDMPAGYDAVNIDIIQMKARIDSNWIELPVQNPGVYNLLEFTNGNSLLLIGDTSVAPGVMTELRLVLGSNNTVVVDGISYELKTPSGQTSGYKVKMDPQSLEPGGVYSIVIDFDVSVSVHQTGNGKYMLKPVVRGYLENALGSIQGVVFPPNGAFYVEALNVNDTAGTVIDTLTGQFLISTVVTGTYDVIFHATPNFSDTTIMGIPVQAGQTTVMDTVFIAPL